jgi:hypothetical protein
MPSGSWRNSPPAGPLRPHPSEGERSKNPTMASVGPVGPRCVIDPRVVDRSGAVAGGTRVAQARSTKELPGMMQLVEETPPRAMEGGRGIPVPERRRPIAEANRAHHGEVIGLLLLLLGIRHARLLTRRRGGGPVRRPGVQERERTGSRQRGRSGLVETDQISGSRRGGEEHAETQEQRDDHGTRKRARILPGGRRRSLDRNRPHCISLQSISQI